MKFSQLEIKEFYDSVRDDVYVDFFSHVLEHSEEVRRFGGSFDSKNFVTIAQGMGHFIRNDGQMKLLLFSRVSMYSLDTSNRLYVPIILVSNVSFGV